MMIEYRNDLVYDAISKNDDINLKFTQPERIDIFCCALPNQSVWTVMVNVENKSAPFGDLVDVIEAHAILPPERCQELRG